MYELLRIGKAFGLVFAMKYMLYSLIEIRHVVKRKSLSVVDDKFRGNVLVKVFGHSLQLLGEMMPTIREVLLKNCYGFDARKSYSAIVDLGANRGVFSVIAAKCAQRVISIECNEAEFAYKFRTIMRMNNVTNTTLISKFAASSCDRNNITMNQILSQYCLKEVAFLKIDIEGAEADLFSANLDWLYSTQDISLEVHPCFGVDTKQIIDTLRRYSFQTSCFNLDKVPLPDFANVPMGYLRATRK